MKYKTVESGYIVTVGNGNGAIPISDEEYERIANALAKMPVQKSGMGLRLRDSDLTWESYEVEPLPETDDIDDSEALEILLGGAS